MARWLAQFDYTIQLTAAKLQNLRNNLQNTQWRKQQPKKLTRMNFFSTFSREQLTWVINLDEY